MICKCWSTKTNLFQDFDKKNLGGNIWCECYQTSISKNTFNKVDLHEAWRDDCDLDPKELDIDFIMQKCLDEVLKMTNPRPINISGKGFNLKQFVRKNIRETWQVECC